MKRTFSLLFFVFLIITFFVAPGVFGQKSLSKDVNVKTLSKEKRWELISNYIKTLNKVQQQDDRHDERKERIVNGNL